MKLQLKDFTIIALIIVVMYLLLTKGCGEKAIVKDTLLQHRIDSLKNEAQKQKDTILALKIDKGQYEYKIDSLKQRLQHIIAQREIVYITLPSKQETVAKLTVPQLEVALAKTFNTDTVKAQDTAVRILPKTARLTLNMVDSFAAVKNENKLYKDGESYYLQVQMWQDSTIQSQYHEIETYDRLVTTQDATIKSLEKQKAIDKKALKKQKRKTTFLEILLLGVIGYAIVK